MALLQEGLVMVDQRHLPLVVGETDAEETPGVPRINVSIGFFVGDKRLNGILHPENMAARRAHDHLLWRGDEVVVQHLAVRIQDSLIDHLGLQIAAFEPGLAMRTLEIKRVVFQHFVLVLRASKVEKKLHSVKTELFSAKICGNFTPNFGFPFEDLLSKDIIVQ